MDQTPPPAPPSTTTPQPDPPTTTPTRPPVSISQPFNNSRPWTPPSSNYTLPSTPTPRIAIGVPSPQPPPASFASLASPSYQPSHIRQPMQGIPISARPPVGVIRPPPSSSNNNNNNNSSSNTPTTPQSFQGHGMIRGSNQPWLSSSPAQGKPPLPSPSTLRPFQQRPETYGAHFTPPRSITQQQMGRVMPSPGGLGSQRSGLGVGNKVVVVEMEEVSNKVVTKRSVRDLLNQIDPLERLDPGVEDVLVDVAEEFVESITRFGCKLAKHRKSPVLEAKDVLMHLERNWNMSLPGFGGDEIKTYKKPVGSDVHRERIAAIKKSSVASDMGAGTKSVGGQSGGNTKSHVAKGAAAAIEAA